MVIRHLFYWILVPIVQAALDEFCVWWNQHTVCRQPDKDMPSGHVPQDAVEHPQLFGGVNCLIHLPKDTIHNLRNYLAEEVGPREKYQQFFPDEFISVATQVHSALGSPEISLLTAWSIFTKMSDMIEANQLF